MNLRTPVLPAQNPSRAGCQARVDVAARRMFDAENALHTARQAHVDEWASAAYDRLHEAIAAHTAALIEQAGGTIDTTSPDDSRQAG